MPNSPITNADIPKLFSSKEILGAILSDQCPKNSELATNTKADLKADIYSAYNEHRFTAAIAEGGVGSAVEGA